MTMNQVVNAAVAQFSQIVMSERSDAITTRRDALRSYWDEDPEFRTAISDIVKAEGLSSDPAKGNIVVESANDDQDFLKLLDG